VVHLWLQTGSVNILGEDF